MYLNFGHAIIEIHPQQYDKFEVDRGRIISSDHYDYCIDIIMLMFNGTSPRVELNMAQWIKLHSQKQNDVQVDIALSVMEYSRIYHNLKRIVVFYHKV